MPSQPTLRPFDIAVSLQLLLVPESRYEPLAEALVTSTSAVHRSVARLQLAGLCLRGMRTVHHAALREFLLHGVRFAFPAVIGAERTGVPTAAAHPDVRQLIAGAGGHTQALVWPSESGTARGATIAPLFPGVVAVAARSPRLHELLASVDVLRTGSAHERAIVGEALAARLLTDDGPEGGQRIEGR